MLQISDRVALENYSENIERARWTSKAVKDADLSRYAFFRLRKDVFEPVITRTFSFEKSSKVFAIGSCFAREVETALLDLNVNVLSVLERGSNVRIGRGGYTNRYNTASMLNEIKFAFGLQDFDKRSVVAVDETRDAFLDVHSHPAGGLVPLAETLSRRSILRDHFSKLKDADVFVITLGLSEAWFDKETGQYINISPATGKVFEMHPGRFEFHVLDHADNMACLEEIYSILKKVAPNIKIVVTTSPVPLLATFSGRDVVVANTHSKSTLRSCAEQWCWLHPDDIEYFPSYEMAINSNPDLVWMTDRIHVQPVFVRQIMRTFVANYIKDADLQIDAEEDEKLIQQTIAESRAQRHLVGLAPEDTSNAAANGPAQLAKACKFNYRMRNYDACLDAGEPLIQIWQDASRDERKKIRKDVSDGLRFACFAAFARDDIPSAMSLYNAAIEIKQVSWELGIRVAKLLINRDELEKAEPVIKQLQEWSSRNPKYAAQFAELLEFKKREQQGSIWRTIATMTRKIRRTTRRRRKVRAQSLDHQ